MTDRATTALAWGLLGLCFASPAFSQGQPGEVLQRWKDRNHNAHPEWNLEPFFEAKPEDSGLWRPVASRLAEDQSGLPANERRNWVMAPWPGCTDLRLRVVRREIFPGVGMEPDQVVTTVSPFEPDPALATYRVGTCLGIPVTPVPEPDWLFPGAALLAALDARRRRISQGEVPAAGVRAVQGTGWPPTP